MIHQSMILLMVNYSIISSIKQQIKRKRSKKSKTHKYLKQLSVLIRFLGKILHRRRYIQRKLAYKVLFI
jgi:hypothetical protein